MSQTVSIDINIDQEESKQLASILGCDADKLEDKLAPFCQAAAEEYVRMFLGQKVFTRGSDMKEYRLFLLIQHAFGGKIPSEQKICDLFQTTTSRSRSLAKSVMSKYQYELQTPIKDTLRDVMRSANQPGEGEDYLVQIDNKNMVDQINLILGTIDGALPQVSKRRGTVCTYKIKPSSYTQITTHLGLSTDDDG